MIGKKRRLQGCLGGLLLILSSCNVVAAPGSPSSTALDENIPPPTVPAGPVGGATAYYVDVAGSDSNNGTSTTAPFQTLTKAIAVIQPGQIIYVRGGTHSYSTTTSLALDKKGSAAAWLFIWAYPGEHPVIDFGNTTLGTKQGFYIKGNYWYLKGLEITRAGRSAIRVTGSYNVIDQCQLHHNNDSGLQIGLDKGVVNPGDQAAWNQVINSDSYLNCDLGGSTGDGGNADGFACKLNPGIGNRFYGCRSWENSDDGWDLYLADYKVVLDHCWTWHNGDPASYTYSGGAWGGNGNGFKVGGGDAAKVGEHYSHGHHLLTNCIAFNMNYGATADHRAFDRNNNRSGVTMINCLAFTSIRGFSFSSTPDDGSHHSIKNSVAFGCSTANQNLAGDTVQDRNSWNLGLSPSAADFQDLSETAAKAARGSDGSLPLVFGRLKVGSSLIGVGSGGLNLGAY